MSSSSAARVSSEFPDDIEIPSELRNHPWLLNQSTRLRTEMATLRNRFATIEQTPRPTREQHENAYNMALRMHENVREQIQSVAKSTQDQGKAGKITKTQFRTIKQRLLTRRIENSNKHRALRSDRERYLSEAVAQRNQVRIGLRAMMKVFISTFMRQAEYGTKTLKRTRGAQDSWKSDVLEQYGSTMRDGPMPRKQNDRNPKIWDPMLQKMYAPSLMTAAHIVPWSIGPELAGYMFGQPDGNQVIHDLRNCIVMIRDLEKMFDGGWFVLMPIAPQTDPPEYRIHVLNWAKADQPIQEVEAGLNLRVLHNRKLDFRGSKHRPAARYLYFHFVRCVLNAREQGWDGFEDERKLPTGVGWATMGAYLRGSLLNEYCKEIGDAAAAELPELGGTFSHSPLPKRNQELEKDLVMKLADILNRVGRGEFLSANDED